MILFPIVSDQEFLLITSQVVMFRYMKFTCDELMQVVYIMIWSSFSFFLLFACDSLWRCTTPSCFCFFSMLLSSHSHMQSCLWYQFLTPNFIGQIMLIWMLWVSMVMMNWMISIKRSKACQKEQLKTVRRQIQKVWICRVSLSIQLITCLKFQGAQVYLVDQIN